MAKGKTTTDHTGSAIAVTAKKAAQGTACSLRPAAGLAYDDDNVDDDDADDALLVLMLIAILVDKGAGGR